MNIESQIQAREDLIFQNLDRIADNVRRARRSTAEELAVLVLDSRDEHGRAILEIAHHPASIEAHLAEAARRGREPLMVWSLPRRIVIALVREHFPELADATVQVDADGGFLTFAVAHGGAAATILHPGQTPDKRPFMRMIIP